MKIEKAQSALRRKNLVGSWAGVKNRLYPYPQPTVNVGFTLPPRPTVYTVGSCFARNVEEYLELVGADVPTLGFSVPSSEWGGLRRNGILNKYTPAAIYEDFSWASSILLRGDGFKNSDAEKFIFDLTDGLCIDLQLAGYRPVTRERLITRRKEIFELLCKSFQADCITITLGLIEAWKQGDTYIQQPPASRDLLKQAEAFEFCVLDGDTCYKLINDSIAILKMHNPEVRVLLTVSPVPLERTFTDEDILIANMNSKSLLRSVASKVSALHENVDYFPSYEMVTLQDTSAAFEDDLRHVRDEVVGDIVGHLLKHYMPDLGIRGQLFHATAGELGKKDPNIEVFEGLLEEVREPTTLSDSELTVYLRACWRLRRKPQARKAASLIMQRSTRRHSTLRAVGHIFPKIGLLEEGKSYASDVLGNDPGNALAQRILAQ